MRELNHPNIIKLYQVFESDHSIYLILDLIDGGNLFNRLAKRFDFEEKHISIALKKIISAVLYLHENDIMHRDLKPQNILIKSQLNDFDIKIVDFGLSCYIKEENPIYLRCGTPGYVAPEILNSKDDWKTYSEKCDVFSIGVLFYIM